MVRVILRLVRDHPADLYSIFRTQRPTDGKTSLELGPADSAWSTSGLSAQYGWSRRDCGMRADYGVRDYRIIARNAAGLVSSCLLGLTLLTLTGLVPTTMAA